MSAQAQKWDIIEKRLHQAFVVKQRKESWTSTTSETKAVEELDVQDRYTEVVWIGNHCSDQIEYWIFLFKIGE